MTELDARGVISLLNSLATAELGRVQGELEKARAALATLGQEELVDRLGQAQASLRGGDVKAFRKAVSHVTARLGHLKD